MRLVRQTALVETNVGGEEEEKVQKEWGKRGTESEGEERSHTREKKEVEESKDIKEDPLLTIFFRSVQWEPPLLVYNVASLLCWSFCTNYHLSAWAVRAHNILSQDA